ncbi:glutathione transferase GstA [Roseibium denhamense]|uniref:Glutathione S-transferase n=1 Tax=Roseibium denhamense TaxID=76305 RepID=A0ABY1P2V4_9HYPH|nr:glutathione binding-like protein [Roseibium denhamense]MTI07748.1 glutathione transferase GstA [Roseibium denhamense]SMP25160.1 glutathione S-transferase [Roseibium denhamense]
MKLYYKSGACSMAAHILLNEAGADYALEKVDTAQGLTESGADFSLINPRGYVPALEQADGSVLTENTAILAFLAGRFPALAANDSEGDSHYRLLEILSFLSSELHKAFSPYFSGATFSQDRQAENAAKLRSKLTQFERLLSQENEYLLGNRFSVADAYAFVILNWTTFIGVSLADWPHTQAYVDRIRARRSVQMALETEGLAA